jgi:hypothetical protein
LKFPQYMLNSESIIISYMIGSSYTFSRKIITDHNTFKKFDLDLLIS